MTNDHKLDNFKHQKCILSQFWGLKVQNQSVSMATLFLKALGKTILCLFQLLVATGIPWHVYLLFLLHGLSPQVCLQGHTASSAFVGLLCVSLVIGFRAYLENGGWPPYLKILNLIIVVKTHFPNKIWKLHKFQDVWTYLSGGHHSTQYKWQDK